MAIQKTTRESIKALKQVIAPVGAPLLVRRCCCFLASNFHEVDVTLPPSVALQA
jgi:hypothetical protein